MDEKIKAILELISEKAESSHTEYSETSDSVADAEAKSNALAVAVELDQLYNQVKAIGEQDD